MFTKIKAAVSGWVRSRFFEAAEQSPSLPYWRTHVEDISKALTVFDYNTIVSASRKLYANCGIVKAVDDKAMYAIGRAWLPTFTGKDKTWGKLATNWLVEKYYPISDIRGGIYDFRTNLYLDSVQVDVSGDFGILLTESETGWPQTQRVPSHRISSVDAEEGEALKSGKYAGLKIRHGVIYNPRGRAVAFRVKTDDGFKDVSARDFIHVFDPSWYDQGRGIPAFTHALNELRSLKTTQEFEQMAMQICSSIGLVEENETGGPDPSDPAVGLRRATSASSSTIVPPVAKTFLGGLIKYFRSGTGGKLSTMQHGRPGPNWGAFWDRIIKIACAGISWPYEILWGLHTVNGAPLRVALQKAKRCVEDRQDLLRPSARREVQYAIAKAIKIGELPENDEWFLWDFTLPAFITADIGREAQQEREDYKIGLTTLEDILAPQGITVERHYRQLAQEYKQRQEIAQEEGVPPEVLSGIPQSTTPAKENKK